MIKTKDMVDCCQFLVLARDQCSGKIENGSICAKITVRWSGLYMLFEIDQEEPKLKCRPINNRSIAEHPLLITLGLWFGRFGSLAVRLSLSFCVAPM